MKPNLLFIILILLCPLASHAEDVYNFDIASYQFSSRATDSDSLGEFASMTRARIADSALSIIGVCIDASYTDLMNCEAVFICVTQSIKIQRDPGVP